MTDVEAGHAAVLGFLQIIPVLILATVFSPSWRYTLGTEKLQVGGRTYKSPVTSGWARASAVYRLLSYAIAFVVVCIDLGAILPPLKAELASPVLFGLNTLAIALLFGVLLGEALIHATTKPESQENNTPE